MRLSEGKNAYEEQHHDQTAHSQTTFLDRDDKLYSMVKEIGNPFLEEPNDLLTTDSKIEAHV